MKKTVSKKKLIIIITAAVLVIMGIWTVWGNTALEINSYTVESENLPDAFSGFRIAHISDFHDAEIGESNEKLISMLRETEPDIIAITGDFIDSRRPDVEKSLAFAREIAKIAPCYYVTGNHESNLYNTHYAELEKGLIDAGINLLHDKEMFIEKDGAKISVLGIDDPDFAVEQGFGKGLDMTGENIASVSESEGFRILLSHRPESFEEYVKADMDIVLTGHAHGGQFRLPFLGGVNAPHQGWFPKYDAGIFTEDDTSMLVSRGIGNSVIPMRFNNRPEIIIVDLKAI